MVVLAALVHLPRRVIGAFGVATIALHNLLDVVHVAGWNGPATPVPSAAAKMWMVLHQAGFTPLLGSSSPLVWVEYPLIPWVGVMAAGYAFGAVYELERERRIRLLRYLGLSLVVAFVAIRFIDIYGDPAPWSTQPSRIFTLLSFINTTKYPPSLLYLLMTIGPSLVALSWFESWPHKASGAGAAGGGPAAALITFGRVPLFFYLLQWPLAHGSAIAANIIAGRPFGYLLLTPPAIWPSMNNGFHGTVMFCWAGIIAIEYPLPRFARPTRAIRYL
jgi:uncharacterized membrane protein